MGLRPNDARLALALGIVLVATSGCSIIGGTLGGRQTCWPQEEQRAPSLWRGTLRLDANGDRLETPEGDAIPLIIGDPLSTSLGDDAVVQVVRGSDVVARSGDDVTLFGGAGADGALVVCAVEERHSA